MLEQTSFDSEMTRDNLQLRAGVAELVDAQDLKSCVLRGVRVRFPPSAPPRAVNILFDARFRAPFPQKTAHFVWPNTAFVRKISLEPHHSSIF